MVLDFMSMLLLFTCIYLCRLQKLTHERSQMIETVNRERKHHQVI